MTELFHTFPPTGFRKLPHTILKMAAVARRGRADSVMHPVGLSALKIEFLAFLNNTLSLKHVGHMVFDSLPTTNIDLRYTRFLQDQSSPMALRLEFLAFLKNDEHTLCKYYKWCRATNVYLDNEKALQSSCEPSLNLP